MDRDISVVGFNDNPAFEFLKPPLSSVRLATEVAGRTAVDLLVERRDMTKTVRLQPPIKWRDSTF